MLKIEAKKAKPVTRTLKYRQQLRAGRGISSTPGPIFAGSLRLYRFIRLILGPDISNLAIGRRWKIDQKNFHTFAYGKSPVPRIEKLESLSRVLKINKHLVFAVANGASAELVYRLIKSKDLKGQMNLIFKGRN